MSLTRLSHLLATGAAATALAVGGLSLTPDVAHAASTSASYTCASKLPIPVALSSVLTPSFTVPATFTADNLPSTLAAAVPVPAGIPVVGTFDFNNISASGLGGILTGLSLTLQSNLNTVLGQAGGGQVAVPINGAFSQLDGGIATLNGQLGSFTPTSAGDLPIPVPTSFDFGLVVPLFDAVGYRCTLNNPAGTAPIGVLHISGGGSSSSHGKAGSTLKAKTAGPVRKGDRPTVVAKVKNSLGQKASGKVIAELKGKRVGHGKLKNGKARLHLKRLAVGTYKVEVTYLGNATTMESATTVTVRVVRG